MSEEHLKSFWRCLRKPIYERGDEEGLTRIRGIPNDTTGVQGVRCGEALGDELIYGEDIFLRGWGKVNVREQTERSSTMIRESHTRANVDRPWVRSIVLEKALVIDKIVRGTGINKDVSGVGGSRTFGRVAEHIVVFVGVATTLSIWAIVERVSGRWRARASGWATGFGVYWG